MRKWLAGWLGQFSAWSGRAADRVWPPYPQRVAVRDLLDRLTWLLPAVRQLYPATPWPWKRCHCGALADYRSEIGVNWCWPCKYAMHDTCECSQENDQ